MNALRRFWCAVLIRLWKEGHAWRRARKDEASPFPIKICRRCGLKQSIKARIRVVKGPDLERVRGGAS